MRQWLAAAGVVAFGIAAAAAATADPPGNVSPGDIDSLVVPIDQITPRMDYASVEQAPAPSATTANPTDPCYVDTLRPDAAEIFGTGFQAFRDVNYSGVGNILVNQAVAVYPDDAAAAAVVRRLTDGVSACRASGPAGLTVANLSPAGASWAGSICADEARAVRNVAIRVQACHMDSPAGVASTVAGAISAKVNGAA